MLQRIELTTRANRQILRELAHNRQCERLLGALLSTLPFDHGTAWALVPANSAFAAEEDFDEGIFSPDEEELLPDQLAEWVVNKLRADSDGFPIVAFEYWTDIEDDAGVGRTFRIGQSLFDYADRDASLATVAHLLGSSLWFPTVGLIGNLPRDLVGIDRCETDISTLEHLVTTLDAVLVGAWDAEGYVVWEPSNVAPS
jgi:hypothetical protein